MSKGVGMNLLSWSWGVRVDRKGVVSTGVGRVVFSFDRSKVSTFLSKSQVELVSINPSIW